MMLRRLKEDVEKNLAPKQETIIEVRWNKILMQDLFFSPKKRKKKNQGSQLMIAITSLVSLKGEKTWRAIVSSQVELTDIQKKYYRAILERNFSFLSLGASSNSNVPNLLNTMMELRKCCNHPYLINGITWLLTSFVFFPLVETAYLSGFILWHW